jgi:hypothetical protein
VSGAVGDEDVGELGRPDPVEDLDTEAVAKACEQLGRQRFTCGDGLTE